MKIYRIAKIHLTKEEIEKEFKDLTGDSIEIARIKMTQVDLRNIWRENGYLNTPIEPELYDQYAIELLNEYDNFRKKSKYLFHVTSKENINSIIEHGLAPGFKQRQEGISALNRIYLAANEATAMYYSFPGDILLRVMKSFVFNDLEEDLLAGGGAYSTNQTIPASSLEIKVGRSWIPLMSYSQHALK